MYKSGEKVIVYGGTTDENGMVTNVELAEILEVGEHQLIVRPLKNHWTNKPAVVHINRCQPITNRFSIPPLVPTPETGDLVMIWEWTYGDNDVKTKVGTVAARTHQIEGVYLECHVGDEILKVEIDKCIILQSYSKKS